MKRVTIALLMVFIGIMNGNAQLKIDFEVRFTEPQAHYAEVQMNISGLPKAFVDVKMPVWQPGSYLIREFAKNVENFAATASGKPARVEKINKNTWRIHTAKSLAIKVNYRVYAFEQSVRTSFVDASHAFLSPTGVFMYPDGYIKAPSTVKIIPHATWTKVSTGLEQIQGNFSYRAADFDILFDSPIEVGNQDVFEFNASGVRHEVAMYGGGNYDKERLKVDMAKIVEEATAVYGDNPNKHYVFIIHNFSSGRGGLEHLNSTTLGATRNGYTVPGIYNSFLTLVGHEYNHLWNVKRLRPVALGPFDYDKENYTTSLWIAEGFTSYYATKFMLRAGFDKPETFVNKSIGTITTIENSAGGKVQSAAQSSFDTWIIQYRPNENSANNSISYYTKGMGIGIIMDLAIAQATGGKKSLDDVLKAMYLEGKRLNRGYTDAEFKAMVEKVSGISFTDFWTKYVDGTAPIDFKKYFGYAGITVKNENEGKEEPFFGVATKKEEGRILVSTIARGSGGWIDGVNVNDEIIAIDDVAVAGVLDRTNNIMLGSRKIGDKVKVTLKRDGQTKEIHVTLVPNTSFKLSATIDSEATPAQKAVRQRWMEGK